MFKDKNQLRELREKLITQIGEMEMVVQLIDLHLLDVRVSISQTGAPGSFKEITNGKFKRRMWKVEQAAQALDLWLQTKKLDDVAKATDRPRGSVRTLLHDIHSGERELPAPYKSLVDKFRASPLDLPRRGFVK